MHPDGVYVGKMSQLHDIFHVYKLNKIPSLTRQRLLKWDDALIAPRYAWYRRISRAITDKSPLQPQDNIFVESYSKQLCAIKDILIPAKGRHRLKHPQMPWRLKFLSPKEYAKLDRPFIDQDNVQDEDCRDIVSIKKMSIDAQSHQPANGV